MLTGVPKFLSQGKRSLVPRLLPIPLFGMGMRLGQAHHAINEYQLRLDVQHFYISFLYYVDPLILILVCNNSHLGV